MPRQVTWDTSEAWLEWANGDSSPVRTVDGWLKCSYNPISVQGYESEEAVRARYRFGQYYSTETSVYDNQEGPGPGLLNPPGSTAIPTEFGFSFLNRNGRLQNSSATKSDFTFPSVTPGYISCWIKSSRSEYTTRAYVAIYHASLAAGGIYYAIIIEPPGLIKGLISVSPFITIEYPISPVNGDVAIGEDEWHHVMFFLCQPYAVIVDNDVGTSPNVLWPQSGADDAIFNIGGTAFNDTLGFSGIIDEVTVGAFNFHEASWSTDDFVPSYRFARSIAVSPVIDTGEDDSLLSSILGTFDEPNGSFLQFSFRASNTEFARDDASPAWSGFTSPYQIISGSIANISTIGTYARGRYHQIRVVFNPSNDDSPTSDPLRTDAPSIQSLTLTTARENVSLYAANSAYVPGTILAQIVNFENDKTIDKVTLDLAVNSAEYKNVIEGKGESISFQAANFQTGRDTWAFQPVPSFDYPSSGTPITNTLQSTEYLDGPTAVSYAPSLAYRLYFPEAGVYDLWGYGYTENEGIFWGLDEDPSDLRKCVLGSGLHPPPPATDAPYWTKFGSIYIEEGGAHTFTVYLAGLETILLDQWYFTKNHNLQADFEAIDDSFITPLPLSEGPFVTAVRLRSLNNGDLDSLSDPLPGSVSITSWRPSENMLANGKFNYEMYDSPTFTNGLSIEFWQIGGGRNNFAAWSYVFPSDGTGVGTSKISTDYGQTFA